MAYLPIEKIDPEGTVWSLHCAHCGRKVGDLEHSEIVPFLAFLTREQDAVLCFDCEESWYARLWAVKMLGNSFGGSPACLV